MADPDLQIIGWKGGSRHPHSEMGGGGGDSKNIFFGLKISGGGGVVQALPLDLPLQSVWRLCMWIFKGLN